MTEPQIGDSVSGVDQMLDTAMNSKPETARQALERWDSGDSLWTVEMGGLGPGYEQVIHIAAFELIRKLLLIQDNRLPFPDEGSDEWGPLLDRLMTDVNREQELGMSGAQAGASQSLAYKFVMFGYKHMLDQAPQDRLILVDSVWPRKKEVEVEHSDSGT